jgi:RimJ/RimL family protein N-acetyltransferase
MISTINDNHDARSAHMEPQRNAFDQPIGAPLPEWRGAKPPGRAQLAGRYCRIEAVDVDAHAADLFEAYDSADDGRDWTYLGVGPFESAEAYREHLARLAASADPLHYAVIDSASGKAVGTFALMRIDPANGVIEVGHVVYSPRLKRTRIATEAMFLLMQYVFDELGYRRFEWKCDSLNGPSRAAALRYGFTFEGIFRQAIVYRQRNRDTAWFSIIDSEWPVLRPSYTRWLSDANFDAEGGQVERLADLIARGRAASD